MLKDHDLIHIKSLHLSNILYRLSLLSYTITRFNSEVTERHAILTIKDASKLDDGPIRLQLENDLGSDSAVLKVQVNDRPDPPRFPVVENIRDDSVVLSWKPPLNDGGSFITEYVVERNEPPSDKWIRVASTRFAFHNVTGLSPNKEYCFRVFADNFYGRSEPCEPTAPVKTEEPEANRKKKQLEGNNDNNSYTLLWRHGLVVDAGLSDREV
ncbi:twitchin [Elysia marginata]|uniref:Twitchin n=1 Tax=Elysia marginata TaxID=1093978 RepID=A0AAV4EBU0_9GAST|nr:twitchin [Elysia marginata]